MANNLTPAMKQYMDIKAKNPDCLVLFRMGDFYETFYDDAKTAARELEITLTARGKGEKRAPLAGIPYHALDQYLLKLIKKGYKVAIVEQTEDPKKAKGLVKRDLIRIVTPGTIVEQQFLEGSQNNYLMSISYKESDTESEKKSDNDKIFGIAFVDISTGEFKVTEIRDKDKFLSEIAKTSPSEIIFPSNLEDDELIKELKKKEFYLTEAPVHTFYLDNAKETIRQQLNSNLNNTDMGKMDSGIECAGSLLEYLRKTQKRSLEYIDKIQTYTISNHVILDSVTVKNLELVKNVIHDTKEGSLFGVLDKTKTPMGSRLLRQWILSPLQNIDQINQRLDAIEFFVKDIALRQQACENLRQINDVERLISKISFGASNPRDLLSLKRSLEIIPKIKILFDIETDNKILNSIKGTETGENTRRLIENAIRDEPNISIREGNIIKDNYDKELDQLRRIKKDAKKIIAEMEEKEKEKTGIKTLRISYNRVFGYFIEVTKRFADQVPDNYIRKQTQVNTERYITEELKELESKILTAEEKMNELEYDLFNKIVEDIKSETKTIQKIAENIAVLDSVISLAVVAHENNYSKPIVDEERDLILKGSRHPVVEQITENFVANDCILTEKEKIMIITGPNMAGKSTYMRQIALIALMGHIGSFVPAEYAKIGRVDRIFTRVGAYDDLVHGQSTFMVEMSELANILNNATDNSLIILDEIGRGTSTFDGVSIAWSAAEYIIKTIRAKTLFATHYHILNQISKEFKGVKNYNILVKEEKDEIVFLRKIVEGGTDKSYGVHVASLAGMPKKVIERAREIQFKLEEEDNIKEKIIIEKENVRIKKTKESVSKEVKLKKAFQKGLDEF